MSQLISSPTSKGQVTIPAVFRKKFRIDTESLLQFSEQNGNIVITPLKLKGNTLREYSKKEIEAFMKDDKISN